MTNDEMRQHLEMLLADSEARHKDIELLYETTSKLAEAAKADRDKISGLIEATQTLARVTGELLQITQSHERRLATLEGSQENA